MLLLKKVGLTCNSRLTNVKELILDIISSLQKKNIQVFIDNRIKRRIDSIIKIYSLDKTKNVDLMVTLGGDGTMLRAIHDNLEKTKLFFGINMGRLGFLSEVQPKSAIDCMNKILCKKCTLDKRELLEISVMRNNKKIKKFIALNEMVIHQKEVARMAHIKTEVDNRKLAVYFADGVIVATPTGSSAYSLSAGGPLVHPTLPAIIVTPINSHSFTQKPIVIPNSKKIILHTEETRQRMQLTIDGQIIFDLMRGDKIIAKKYKEPISFLRMYEENYFKTIRQKLKWGEPNM